jgi:spore maturation protein SpmA/spore maturation protein SpmB
VILNYIWFGFFAVAFITALLVSTVGGDIEIWSRLMNTTFSSSKTAFEICLGLTGVLSFWLGLMKIGEKGGVIALFSWLIHPLFSRIFPGIPAGHPAAGSILMNVSANMLGLDNAATPMGLKAMKELQELNPKKDTATDAMIMFLVLNTSGLTIIPISIMMYRSQFGAANPSDIFLPLLIATFCSSLAGLLLCCLRQRVKLFDKVIIGTLGGAILVVGGMAYFFSQLSQEQLTLYSTVIANVLLFGVIMLFLGVGIRKRLPLFSTFVEGAKEGFQTVVTIIPYQIAMFVGISVFRECGALDYITDCLGWAFAHMGLNTDFVPALPTAMLKPLNGSGARAMMLDVFQTYGVDSFVGHVASTIQGSTDTTMYVLAVYFGSVNISKIRYAATYGLLADLIGIIAAISVSYLFWH